MRVEESVVVENAAIKLIIIKYVIGTQWKWNAEKFFAIKVRFRFLCLDLKLKTWVILSRFN